MLSFNIPVAPGENPEAVARTQILWKAHVKQVHLQRPILFTVTRITDSFNTLAKVMGLPQDPEPRQYYRVDARTNDCPGDKSVGA
ncbi:hypothetical protein [Streptomyces spectabilis]|uniref:Uncharacterized protein n=1 Tax=Streptomyces spectabilis TaxID=68270 RepID=A0A5P2X4C6_STRST|nr:hypothetical protein [Streptomyces spectabilis]MBB5108296.1 hypothetical protein [Streptomyces spectabilis]MCI3901056.1 hypothetical protein [Streptomyces spectabilis]QEV58554.1 hypothetical protein CP982_07380 [Streptomyces spectabilis]GGV45697.1 hypothetical protein GCM10010245_71580 [Streptomyces spectabilis]